jgi:tetratricopeptide (TPR) repeat protein
MLGVPGLQVSTRRALALCVARSRRPAGERYAEFSEILHSAAAVAQGIPREQVIVHLTFATLLKESATGDEAGRLAMAVDESRKGFKIAQENHYSDLLAACALALGNSLAEYENASIDLLNEAVSVLEKGISGFRSDPSSDDHIDESQLYNSLGLAYSRLSERERSAARCAAAIANFEKALDLRDQTGTPDQQLLTVGNLVGAHIRYDDLVGESHGQEILALAERALRIAPEVDNMELRGSVLSNIALAYEAAAPTDAKRIASQAVALMRGTGPSMPLIRSLLNASAIHLRANDVGQGRELLEATITVIEAFRLTSDATRYRAELTETFSDVYHLLEQTLTDSSAPAADIWWAIERNTDRTLLEGMHRRDIELDQDSITRRLGHLPADVVVIHTFVNARGEFGYFSLRSPDGRLRIRLGTHSVDSREMARGMGGTASDKVLWTPIHTAENPEGLNRQLSWLGSRFVGPLLAELDLTGVTRIVMISQYLPHIPWHAIPVPPTGMALGMLWEVVTLPSAAILARLISASAPQLSKAAFVACDPTGVLEQHIAECRRRYASCLAR